MNSLDILRELLQEAYRQRALAHHFRGGSLSDQSVDLVEEENRWIARLEASIAEQEAAAATKHNAEIVAAAKAIYARNKL
jgi:hypothetical protein